MNVEEIKKEIEKGIRAGLKTLLDIALTQGRTRQDVEDGLPQIKQGILIHPDMAGLFDQANMNTDDAINMINYVVDKAMHDYFK